MLIMEHIRRLHANLNPLWKLLCKKPFNIYVNKTFCSCVLAPRNKKIFLVPSLYTSHLRYAKNKSKGGKTKIVKLTDEEMSEVINIEEYRNQLKMLCEKLKKDYVDNLSLRSSANIESLLVKVENEEYPLHELAQISRKGQSLISINMVDFPEAIKPALQAIIESGSSLNPQQDGTMIYLTIPKLSREHRENLAKNAKSLFVKAKEEVRSIQNIFVKEAKRKSDLSEDLVFNASNQIMHIAEQTAVELEKILKIKQKELLGES